MSAHPGQQDPNSDANVISFEELKPLTQAPTEKTVLIDVRERPEVVQGNIPSSVNLPLSELEEALQMDQNDFQRKYSFKKPTSDQSLIFYCLAGVRAAAAAKEFRRNGYKDVRNFEGSWQEWKKREGASAMYEDD